MCCDLQVEVNGQEIFYVDRKLIASFSGKLQKLFNRSASSCEIRIDKLIFSDFPGGSQAFELIVRFCYSKGEIDLNPSNVFLLHHAAKFLEIIEDKSKRCFETIHFWTWSDLLECLNKCQEIPSFITSSDILSKISDNLVEKISSCNLYNNPYGEDCHYTFSDNSSSLLMSSDRSNNCSNRSSQSFCAMNWLRELEFMNIVLFEKVVSTMLARKLHDGMICSFLFHYHKVRLWAEYVPTKRRKIIEIVINSLCSLDRDFDPPLRSLFDLLQSCNILKMERFWRRKLEKMIGSKLDKATLDDLMVRPSNKRRNTITTCAYDVSLILRFLKTFLQGSSKNLFLQRLKRVGHLIDLYLAEVAPDKRLKAGEFLELIVAFPDVARDSHDRLFEVIDLYFKVHKLVITSEEEKIKISSVLKCDKLSMESLWNLSKNPDFPDSIRSDASKSLEILSKDVRDSQISRFGPSLTADEDERLLKKHFPAGKKKCKKVVQTRSEDIVAKICLENRKSLPRLCS